MAEKNFERWRRTAAVTIIGGLVARGRAVVPQVSPAALELGLYPLLGWGRAPLLIPRGVSRHGLE